MPRTRKQPAYRLHRASGQAVVTLDGRDHYLGQFGTEQSHDRYDRLVGEWLGNGRCLPEKGAESGELTVVELIAPYLRHATETYQKDGQPTGELGKIRAAVGLVARLYGRTPVSKFGPLALMAVRESMVEAGAGRKYVNDQTNRIRRMFRWGVERELAGPSAYQALQAVTGLRRGRTPAPEARPVRPAPDVYIDAIKPHVSRQVWAMIELQRLTGMRPGEVVIMRGRDLDTTGKVWIYQPESHKTQHHGYDRIVELGPRARKVIKPFLKADLEAFLFSLADAEAERRAVLHAKRTTPMKYGNRPGTNRKRKPKRIPRDRYDVNSYRRAIQRACDTADVKAKAALIEAGKNAGGDRIIPRWHPHQLRHNFATAVRKQYGIEIARILLGHRSAVVTEVYAEFDRTKARKIMTRIG